MKNIFLHGLGQNSSSWDETIKLFSYKTTCPDLFKMKIKNFKYDSIYKAVEKYLQKYNEPVDICGLSLGGILSMNYAINNPDKVNSLVLIGVQYVMPKYLMQFQSFIFKFLPNKMFSKIGIEKKDAITLVKSMTNLNFENDIEKIKCPVLILCGEKDKANKSACLRLSQLLPNAKYIEITNAGHEVNQDNPKQLAKILNSFLK